AWPPPCGGRLRTRRPHIAGSARCACGASWTVYWGGLTALLACPGSGMSTAGHASPHDHAPGAFKAKPCFAPRRPGTPVSLELLALQRIVVQKRCVRVFWPSTCPEFVTEFCGTEELKM